MYDPQYLPCPPLLPFFVPKREAYWMEIVSVLSRLDLQPYSFNLKEPDIFIPRDKSDYLRKAEHFSSSVNIHKRHWVSLLQNQ